MEYKIRLFKVGDAFEYTYDNPKGFLRLRNWEAYLANTHLDIKYIHPSKLKYYIDQSDNHNI